MPAPINEAKKIVRVGFFGKGPPRQRIGRKLLRREPQLASS
jgi:hypothetical protein